MDTIIMSTLNHKVAVVTGASKGIGAGIAKAFGAAGASVVVNYTASREGAERVVAEIKRQGGKAVAIQGDVSKAGDVRRLFKEAKEAFGALDILVNNAGVYRFEPLESVGEDEFHRQFNTNVLGTILAIQEATKHFGPAGGSIINLSSIASVAQMPNSSVYTASKSAVDALTRVLAIELSARKIRVNAIAPGATATEGLALTGAEVAQSMLPGIPMGRLGRPEDIAPLAVFLASDESAWMTGERVTASGGQR